MLQNILQYRKLSEIEIVCLSEYQKTQRQSPCWLHFRKLKNKRLPFSLTAKCPMLSLPITPCSLRIPSGSSFSTCMFDSEKLWPIRPSCCALSLEQQHSCLCVWNFSGSPNHPRTGLGFVHSARMLRPHTLCLSSQWPETAKTTKSYCRSS